MLIDAYRSSCHSCSSLFLYHCYNSFFCLKIIFFSLLPFFPSNKYVHPVIFLLTFLFCFSNDANHWKRKGEGSKHSLMSNKFSLDFYIRIILFHLNAIHHNVLVFILFVFSVIRRFWDQTSLFSPDDEGNVSLLSPLCFQRWRASLNYIIFFLLSFYLLDMFMLRYTNGKD